MDEQLLDRHGWYYGGLSPQEGKDCRHLVTLYEGGMIWVGIRAWHHSEQRWYNGNEPERATVRAWMPLPTPAPGGYIRGMLHIPVADRRTDSAGSAHE